MTVVIATENEPPSQFIKDAELGQELFCLKVDLFGSKYGGSNYYQKMSPLIKIFALKCPAAFFLWAFNYWFTDYELLPETLRSRDIFKWSLKTC